MVDTEYIVTNVLTKWTFESKPIREWVEQRLDGTVLNACAGKTRLQHTGRVYTNDLSSDIETDTSVDVAKLSLEYDENTFDTIVFDPPWTLYQSNLRYNGRHVHSTGDNFPAEICLDELPIPDPGNKNQVGHARLAKDGFDYLLKPGGHVIQLTYHGACMPQRLNYDKIERVIFDPIGENKAVIGSVDVKR